MEWAGGSIGKVGHTLGARKQSTRAGRACVFVCEERLGSASASFGVYYSRKRAPQFKTAAVANS